MQRDSDGVRVTSPNLTPFLVGFYERVALKLGVDSSFVIQVALGKRESQAVEEALRRELELIASRIANTERREDVSIGRLAMKDEWAKPLNARLVMYTTTGAPGMGFVHTARYAGSDILHTIHKQHKCQPSREEIEAILTDVLALELTAW
jgi:hypothetical protein